MRLIDVSHAIKLLREIRNDYPADSVRHKMLNMVVSILANPQQIPTVDAVEVEKYNALVEKYHELRENFIDYYCSGCPDAANYCLNRCAECVDEHGWCMQKSEKCKGFNPAEVILDDFCSYGERKDNDT